MSAEVTRGDLLRLFAEVIGPHNDKRQWLAARGISEEGMADLFRGTSWVLKNMLADGEPIDSILERAIGLGFQIGYETAV